MTAAASCPQLNARSNSRDTMKASVFITLTLPVLVFGAAPTDSTQDGDLPQSGYLPTHNLDPGLIPNWAVRWRSTYNTNEVFYAKPLVHTPPGSSSELVVTVSNQNIVRVVDGQTGKLVKARKLDPPFLASDTSCSDMPNTVGITGTPYIDTARGTMYFFAKGYKNGASSGGLSKGQYKMYVVKLPDLTDVAGFPVIMDGHQAVNDRNRTFTGGVALQRPGLVSIGDSIIAGFGSHCDFFNYTGMVLSISKTTGAVNTLYALMSGHGTRGAAVWQSGMALAADGNRVFFATGNGFGGGVNRNGKPASGKAPISTLQESVVSLAVGSGGTLGFLDYFQPTDYESLDSHDQDLGVSGVSLLDSTVFKTRQGSSIAVVGGKSGKVYLLDANDLGGFGNAPGGGDKVLQTIQTASVSGVASYPREGGYVYFVSANGPLSCYKYSATNASGTYLAFAGQSKGTYKGRVVPTITSLGGKAGTGVVWFTDPAVGLVAHHAVPVNGKLQEIPLPTTGRVTKMHRPVFGNGRVYTTIGNTVIGVGP
ncbi:hypothetical protein B0T19DRAFT_71530 [Cercophora scortea]|uniref:Uncharacterized protein n=1 Tax=Cercophora scortea TaxID=314031 RepID=A0AAE0MMR5_9PEZI|nr:hypothetical protein B0T19DRAFT_71530 [Cercophora scortea]